MLERVDIESLPKSDTGVFLGVKPLAWLFDLLLRLADTHWQMEQ
jgi:hypothetical protein